MTEARIQTYREFWPYYVGEHRSPVCRALHYFGTTMALSCLGLAWFTGASAWLFVAPIAGYGPAWIGHFFVEGNRPATFRYPIWSLFSDFKMLSLALRGKMGAEVRRLHGDGG